MTQGVNAWEEAQRFIGRESLLLDGKLWDEWLDLYTPDCVYWIPAWKTDGQLVTDPMRELSLIYYPNRIGLEGRVFRLRTGKASSALAAPRTSHVAQVTDVEEKEGRLHVKTNWNVSSFAEGLVTNHFGYAHYILQRSDGTWRVKSKTTVIANDVIHEVLDFYNV